MKTRWCYEIFSIIILIFCQSSLQDDDGISRQWCRTSGKEWSCECSLDGLSAHCKSVSVHYRPGEIALIECNSNDKNWSNYLSGLDIGAVGRVRINNCPLPEKPFSKVITDLGITNATALRFRSYMNIGNDLTIEYFEGLHNITSIGLISNNLTSLPPNVWSHFPDLKSLNLLDNALQLQLGAFPQLKSLSSLSFTSNLQREIPPNLFSNLTELELLVLVNNKIDTLSRASFHGLAKLKQLDISNNLLTELPADVFAELTSLVNVSLGFNNFRKLSGGIFLSNKNLEKIDISRNKQQLNIGNGLFAQLPQLKTIVLNESLVKEIPQDMLKGAVSLTYLSLAGNKLTTLPEELFRDTQNLETLKLNSNELVSLPDGLFWGLSELKHINLNRNNLSVLSKSIFRDLKNLDSLHMNYNKLTTITMNTFARTYELRYISMKNNSLQFSSSPREFFGLQSPFNKCTKLEKLLLSHNFIDEICADWKHVLLKLDTLDLSWNNISRLDFEDFNIIRDSKNATIDVRNNHINTINLQSYRIRLVAEQGLNTIHPYINIKVNNNPLHCDCFALQLVHFLRKDEFFFNTSFEANNLTCATPSALNGQLAQAVPLMDLTCPQQPCPEACQCQFRPLDRAYIVNCSGVLESSMDENMPPFTNLTTIPQSNFTVLDLTHQNLSEWPSMLPSGYDKVRYLDISYNNLSAINPLALPENLTTLYLAHNNFSYIDDAMLQFLKTIINNTHKINVSLSNNPLHCDCKAINLLSFLQKYYEVFEDLDNIRCNGTGDVLIEMTTDMLCPQPVVLIVSLSIACVTLVTCFALTVVLYYKHQQKIKVWLYAHRMCLWCVSEEEVDKDKLYDAFISYSHKDEEFVVGELVPGLDPPFKLCLHFRDWIAGDFIPNQITRSVEESRRTVVILSPAFLDSVWGKLEFRAAHSPSADGKESQSNCRSVRRHWRHAEIGSRTESLFSDEHVRQMGDPWFWRKLRYALPHQPALQGKRRKRALEDKLELIRPNITSSTLSVSTDSIKTNGTVQVDIAPS